MRLTTPYARVLASTALANLGDGIRFAALPLLATLTTRDPLLISGLVAAAFLPWVLFGLPVGVLVDRLRPERVLRIANTGRLLVLIALTAVVLADVHNIGVLYVAAFLLGIGEAAYDNASQTIVPRIVADANLERANSALVTAERLGQDMIGPALGGVLFAVAAVAPFGVNTIALAIAAALLLGIRTPSPTAPPAAGTLWRDLAEGMRWLGNDRPVRRIIVTGAVLTFATMAWESTLVLLATGPVGLSPAGYGAILGAGAIGGVAGAALVPVLTARIPPLPLQIGALGGCAIPVLALALYPSIVLIGVAWGATGGLFSIWNIVAVSQRQRLVPPELLGRVNSAARTLSITAVPTGAVAGGALASLLGFRGPLWISGTAVLLLAAVFAVSSQRAAPAPTAKEPVSQ